MTTFAMTVGGDAARADGTFPVIDPASGQPYGEAPLATAAHVDAAFRAAMGALPTWAADAPARRQGLAHAATALREAANTIAPVLTAEQGKPLREATIEVERAAATLGYFATLELPGEVIQDDERARVEVVRRPIGPVAAITPWNFPVSLAFWKIAPALAAGNTVVLKPSPYTPLSTLLVGELLRERFPPGVLNVVAGGHEVGELMTGHPLARKISFTGSVATGCKVAAAAAPELKRLTLELGGNDAAIVLDDVSIDAIVDKLFWGAFINCGQVCSAIKRVYVSRSLYHRLVDSLGDRARSVQVGPGIDPATQLGPVNNVPQLQRVTELVGDAVARGARAVIGGRRIAGPGNFYQPTILADADDGMRIVDEEQFGPALPLIPYDDVDDAVRRANATHYGLGGSVWGADPERAAAVASRLDCGTAWVNAHAVLAPHQPFGGHRRSGIGVENGRWGLYAYTELQVLWQAKT